MSDNYTDDDFDSDVESGDGEAGDIKSLRRAANSKKKLEQELAEARRLLAFARAGINPDDPKMRYFVKGYDGELTAEAVREAATEAGFFASAPVETPQREIAAAQDRIVSAASGAMYEDTGENAALARMEAALEEGGMEAMMDVARQYGIPIGTEM